MNRKTAVGLIGVGGIWLTAGAALPFVNVMGMFTPEQLMAVRGCLTAVIALVMMRRVPFRVDRYTYLIAITLPLCTLGLFKGIRLWGAGPTIIVVTATPVVNLIIGMFLGRKISLTVVMTFILVLGGVAVAHWGSHFEWLGFSWSVFATVANGFLYEWFARAKASSFEKGFWAYFGMGVLGLGLSIGADWSPMLEPRVVVLVIGFAIVGGFLYVMANLIAFKNLPTNEASVLAQGETPAVILGAWLLLGERLTWIQGIGIGISLFGAWYLFRWLSQQTEPE